MSGITVPDKLYFKIGEMARLVGVEPHVLRYWESEFRQISPVKSKTNQRLYRREDLELIGHIKELLYGQKFTIDGARKKLSTQKISRKEVAKRQQYSLEWDAEQEDLGAQMTSGSKPNRVPFKAAQEISEIVEEMARFCSER